MRDHGLLVVRLSLFILVATMITACSTKVVNIDAKDEVTFSTFETSFHPLEHSRNRIKIRASQASGDYEQTIFNNEAIRIEGTEISGPTQIQGTADLTYYSISFGRDILLNRRSSKNGRSPAKFYLTWDAGLALLDMDLTLENGGSRYSANDNTMEPYGQVGLLFSITPSLDSAITLSGSTDSIFSDESTAITELDLKLNYRFVKHVGIMGGYRWVNYHHYGGYNSDIDIEFNGPFVGINVPL